MVDINEIAESLKVIIDSDSNNKQLSIDQNNTTVGYKRRSWLDNNNSNIEEHKENKDKILSKIVKNNDYHNIDISLSMLRGNPLKITQYIFEISKDEINNITKPLTRTDMIKALELSKESVRTAVKFLIKTLILERVYFQVGKNGWSIYKLKTSIFDEINIAYQKNTIIPLKYNNILLSNKAVSESNSEWDNMDILQLEYIGLRISHINQLKNKNSFKVIQESIYHFAFGLKFNPKAKSYSDPLSVLIGVLRKGEAWIEPNYRSTQEIAQETINNNIKSQIERLKKLEEEAFVLAFTEWRKNLSDEEIAIILKDDTNGTKKFIPKKVLLRSYFDEKIWPSKKDNFLFLK